MAVKVNPPLNRVESVKVYAFIKAGHNKYRVQLGVAGLIIEDSSPYSKEELMVAFQITSTRFDQLIA